VKSTIGLVIVGVIRPFLVWEQRKYVETQQLTHNPRFGLKVKSGTERAKNVLSESANARK